MAKARVLLALLVTRAAVAGGLEASDAGRCPFAMSGSGTETSSSVIVTVADLRDPLLEYLRGRHLQAALQAASELRFVRRDRTDRVEYADVQASAGPTFVERVQLHRWTRRNDGIDGGPAHEVLQLLLVPEHPTAGIEKASMGAALDCVKGRVKVLGPTFSGSAWSLAASLKGRRASDACIQDDCIQVVSGSATGDSVGTPFETLRIGFQRTVHSNGALASGLADFLASLTGSARFALLVEVSSDYGQSFRASLSDKLRNHHPLVLPFPLHIAWLFGEDSDLLPPGVDASGAVDLPSDGGVPGIHFARPSAIERASARASLSLLLKTVAREAVPYVGIVATDVRDRLFLAREIRQLVPDVRVVLFEADVLYAAGRSTDIPAGTLVVSTYSLAANHDPGPTDGGASAYLQFESDASLGVHNAMLLLLEERDAGSSVPPLVEYAYPGDAGPGLFPPVWISQLGANSLWPVAARDGGFDPWLAPNPWPRELSIPNRAPTQFDLIATFCAVVLFVILSWFFFGPQPGELESDHSFLPALADPLSGELGPAFAYGIMFLAWILGLGFIGNLMVHGHPAGHTVIHWIAVISVLLAAAGATLAAGSSLSSLVPFDAHRRSRSIRTGSVFARLFKPGAAAKPGRQWLVIALVFVVSLGLFGYSLLPESDGIGLAAARTQTTHLASGVSVLPCLLLVLAAVTLLALFYVAYRAVLARERSRPKHVMSAQGGLILGSATAAVVPAVLLIWPAHSPISVLPLVSGLLLLLYLSPVALIFPCAIAFIRLVELRGSARTGGGTVEIEAPAARRLALAPVLAAPLLLVASSSFPFVAQRLMVLVFATLEVVFVLIYFGLALMLQALKPGLKGTRVGGWDLVRLGLAAIPTIITLIGLKLPNTGDAVISWLQQVGAVVK